MVRVKLDESYIGSIGPDVLSLIITQKAVNIGEIRLLLYANTPKFKTNKEVYAYRDGIDAALEFLNSQRMLKFT